MTKVWRITIKETGKIQHVLCDYPPIGGDDRTVEYVCEVLDPLGTAARLFVEGKISFNNLRDCVQEHHAINILTKMAQGNLVRDLNGEEIHEGDLVWTTIQGIRSSYRVKKIQPKSKKHQLILSPGGYYAMGNQVELCKVLGIVCHIEPGENYHDAS